MSTNPEYVNPIYVYNHDGLRSSPTGGAFYDGNLFPGVYKNQYFFADYQRGFIRTLDVTTGVAADFATGVDQGVVRMDVRPDGALYYLSYDRGGIFKIDYTGTANRPPTVEAAANKTSGPVGLNVTFSAAGTDDPDADPITYAWDFGDGSTGAGLTASHVYTAAGTYAARLVVSDNRGLSTTGQSITITVGNSAPVVNISTNVTKYVAGSPLTFTGTATDLEDGTLPATSFAWDVDFFHKGHFSDITNFSGVPTASVDLLRYGDTSTDQFYRITLTVTDSTGLSYTTHTDVMPQMANITLATNVGGASLGMDLLSYAAGTSIAAVAGMTRTLIAPPTQTINGVTYNFVGWSDNGAATHNIDAPTDDTVYLAVYNDTAPQEAQGLKATYFANNALSGSPTLTRVDDTVNFDWSTGQPDATIPGDNFSVRWTGKVKAQFTERYTFTTSSDDGVRLWLNGVQLVNNWTDHAPVENSGQINLVAGQTYDIRMEYYEKGGGAVAKLSWASPSTLQQIIPASALLSGVIRGATTAPVVTGIVAATNGKSVTLTWRDLSPNETNFVIQRKGPGNADWADYATVGQDVVTYTDANTLDGYAYRIRAVNANGASVYSQVATITTPTVPAGPSGLIATVASANSIVVAWQDNATNEQKFSIERRVNGTGSFAFLVDADANATSYTDATGITPGTLYDYRITAMNAAGASTTVASGSVLTPATIASPAGTVAAATSYESVTVTIGTTTSETGFKLEFSTDGTNYAPLATLTADATSYVHGGRAASTTYYYRVTALGAFPSLNAPPVVVSATTPTAPVTGGTTLRVNAGGNAFIDSLGKTWLNTAGYFTGGTSTNVKVAVANTIDDPIYYSRRAGTDFTFAANVENGTYALKLHFMETLYSVAGKRKFTVQAEGVTILSNFDIAAEAGGLNRALVKTFTITVTDGKVDLRFIKGLENAMVSGMELILLSTTPTPPPPSASGLTATAPSTTAINLTWVDNATVETGYRVERSTDGVSFTTAATLAANTTAYTDTGCASATQYWYRVTAVGVSESAPPSNVATATTRSTPPTNAGGTTLRVNAGGASLVDSAGNAWAPAGAWTGSTVSTSTVAINGTTDDALYYLRRWGKDFSYAATVANGSYTLKLHFAEPTMTASNRRVFSVQAQGQTVLSNFDIFKEAGLKNAIVKTFDVTVTNGQLNVRFFASVDNALIGSIELIPKDGGTTTPPPTPGTTTLRVNAGGNAYLDGRGNVWQNTAGFFTGGTSTNLSVGVANTVDDPLYYSRRIGADFTFNASVANGTYALTLHFMDPSYGVAGKRKMNVIAEGQTVLSGFDVAAEAGGINRALAKTFTVTVTDGSLDIRFVGTLQSAIVSAVELMPVA